MLKKDCLKIIIVCGSIVLMVVSFMLELAKANDFENECIELLKVRTLVSYRIDKKELKKCIFESQQNLLKQQILLQILENLKNEKKDCINSGK